MVIKSEVLENDVSTSWIELIGAVVTFRILNVFKFTWSKFMASQMGTKSNSEKFLSPLIEMKLFKPSSMILPLSK